MKTGEYRKWIEAGYKNYGTDPWFFLRELAQNSRDAGASIIEVTADRNGENERIIFRDNGIGMTLDHAIQYLFRLYASSKTKDRRSAGMFGIGFWTVLKFNPAQICIESVQGGIGWGVMVDNNLETTPMACRMPLHPDGTCITLIRPACENPEATFQHTVESALSGYCRYLRRNTRQAEALPVRLNGKFLNAPMSLPGPVSLHFRKGPIEGVVGLGPVPRVFLHARGLPVWEGTSLEELSHTPEPVKKSGHDPSVIAHGLAPVFLLNGDNLEVNISRRRAIDSRGLDRVRKQADIALSRLVELAADSLSPRLSLRRLTRKLKKKMQPVFSSFWKTLLLLIILIIPLEYALLKYYLSQRQDKANNRSLSLKVDNNRYNGAALQTGLNKSKPDISYTPRITAWFKLFHVETCLREQGFVETFRETKSMRFPKFLCTDGSFIITMKAEEKGEILLPVPIGFFPDPDSIFLDNQLALRLNTDSAGGSRVMVPATGMLSYRCCSENFAGNLTDEDRARTLFIPLGTKFPENLENHLKELLSINLEKKVDEVMALTAKMLAYDDSLATALKYEKKNNDAAWLDFVLSVGAGDCDIINGVAVLMLRRLDVPARLVVGIVGENGNIIPGMHAWFEYYHQTWRTADATLYSPLIRGGSAQTVLPMPESLARSTRPEIPNPSRSLSSSTAIQADRSVNSANPDYLTKSDPAGKIVTVKNAPEPISVLFIVMTILLGTLIFSGFFLLLKRRKHPQKNPFADADREKVVEHLVGMALHWLLHPQVWGDETDIKYVRILPTLGKQRISLKQALKLSEKGRLCHLDGHHAWASHLAKYPAPILRTGLSTYDPLIKILPGAVNLTVIAGFRVAAGVAARPSTDHVLETVETEAILHEVSRLIGIPCLAAPGLNSQSFYDVDLSRPRSLRTLGLPQKFIAVNTQNEFFRSIMVLCISNRPLGIYKLTEAVVTESMLPNDPPDYIMEQAAKKMLSLGGS